jgi:hypothetical protein
MDPFPYKKYYDNQSASGIASFHGTRIQKGGKYGEGFFGDIVLPFIKMIFPAIGKRAMPSVLRVGEDILSGENVRQSALKRLKEAGKDIADESLNIIKNTLHQSGSGKRRKRKFKSKRKIKRIKGNNRIRINKKRRSKRNKMKIF